MMANSHDAFKVQDEMFLVPITCSYWQIPQLCPESGLFRVGLPRQFSVRTFFLFLRFNTKVLAGRGSAMTSEETKFSLCYRI